MARVVSFVLFIFGVCTTVQHISGDHHGGETGGRLDVFHEILEIVNETSDALTPLKTEVFLEKLFHNFKCDAATPGGECEDAICIEMNGLFSVVGAQGSMTEDQFHNASIVLMHYINNINVYCHQTVDPSNKTFEYYQQEVFNMFVEDGHDDIHADVIDEVLERINQSLDTSHEGHEHLENEENTDPLHDDHDHDHDHEEGAQVVEKKCISPDAVFYQLRLEEDHIESTRLTEVTSFLIYNFLIGSEVKEECRVLPSRTAILFRIFSLLNAPNGTLTETELNDLLTKLKLVEHPEEDDHDHDHDHDHKRKKRSVQDGSALTSAITRVKRQANHDHDHGHESTISKICYTADQIKAIHDLGHDDVITETKFVELSPTLLYMQISDACVPEVSAPVSKTRPSQAEQYGYSSLAIFLICLCSVVGVVIFPFSKGLCYEVFMAIFLGLAVGTLSSDAVLHLIPTAFGIHGHEDDGHAHDHGPGPVIEEYTLYAIVVMAGLYLFYLVEAVMVVFGPAHSHSHSQSMELNKHDTNKYTKTDSMENGTTVVIEHGEKKEVKCSTLAFMVIVGDAIHNFADGLAVGASFSQSVTTGVTTSLSVFCHELPHELGDFAVLLQSGMSVKRAVAWNFVSALTAFAGLYVGLSVGDDPISRRWIFSIAAGMFIYIALVDLLPTLVNHKSNNRKLLFLMHNVGILSGFVIMLLLAMYEEQLNV